MKPDPQFVHKQYTLVGLGTQTVQCMPVLSETALPCYPNTFAVKKQQDFRINQAFKSTQEEDHAEICKRVRDPKLV